MTSRSSIRSRTTSCPGSSRTISSMRSGVSGHSHTSVVSDSSGGSASRSRLLISPSIRYVPMRTTVPPSSRSPQVRTPRSMEPFRARPSG